MAMTVHRYHVGRRTITFTCPSCSARNRAEHEDAGTTQPCPTCNAPVCVPGTDEEIQRAAINGETSRATGIVIAAALLVVFAFLAILVISESDAPDTVHAPHAADAPHADDAPHAADPPRERAAAQSRSIHPEEEARRQEAMREKMVAELRSYASQTSISQVDFDRAISLVGVLYEEYGERYDFPFKRAGGRWEVREWTSDLDDGECVRLSIRANETISAWPSKTLRPILQIRWCEDRLAAAVWTGTAAHVESHRNEHTAWIRIDDDEAFDLKMSQSTNSEALFFRGRTLEGVVPIVPKIAYAETMLFRFTPFNSNPQTVTFNVAGLDELLPLIEEASGLAIIR